MDENLRTQLIDFGHANFFNVDCPKPTNPNEMFATYGTKLFCSPEIRSGMRYRGPEADIYALGLMLYEMQYGDVPDNVQNAYYVPRGTCIFEFGRFDGFTDPLVVDLCRSMLSPDPETRPDISAVARHRLFST